MQSALRVARDLVFQASLGLHFLPLDEMQDKQTSARRVAWIQQLLRALGASFTAVSGGDDGFGHFGKGAAKKS